jgi:O-acetylserine/cysteine efflux transporter
MSDALKPSPAAHGLMPVRHLALALMVVCIWGLNFVMVKVGVTEIPPLMMTALRFIFTAALVVPFTRMTRQALPWILLLSFTLGTMHFTLLFAGMNGVDGATGAILLQLGVPFSTILASVFLRDHLGGWRILGLLMAFGGAAVLAGEPTLPALDSFILLVVSAFSWAVSNLLIKRAYSVTPLAMAGWIALFAAPQAMVWSLIFETNHVETIINISWLGWGCLAYVVVCSSIIAYSTWYHLLSIHPVSQVVPFNLLAPLLGVLAAVLLLGEVLTWQKAVGGILTIGGVAIIIFRQSMPRKDKPAAEALGAAGSPGD